VVRNKHVGLIITTEKVIMIRKLVAAKSFHVWKKSWVGGWVHVYLVEIKGEPVIEMWYPTKRQAKKHYPDLIDR
jgi:hypothetical protein